MPALAARPPSPSGPVLAFPAGVARKSVAGVTCRTVSPAPMYTCPAPNDTPQTLATSPASSDTLVARPGPPTPPATVEIVPAGAWPWGGAAGSGLAEAGAAG